MIVDDRTGEAGKRTTVDASEIVLPLVRQHVDALAVIFAAGGIAVLVKAEPEDERVATFARALGWTPGAPTVFRMSASGRRQLAEGCQKIGDSVTHDWCARKSPPHRVFILDGNGSSLLVNFDPDRGAYSLEPGSMDAERRS